MNDSSLEREIDLLALVNRILKRWKILLIVFLCCTLIGALLTYRSEAKKIEAAVAKSKAAEEENVEGFSEDTTDLSEYAIELRESLNRTLANKLDYIKKSKIDELNQSNTTYIARTLFYIESEVETSVVNEEAIEDLSGEEEGTNSFESELSDSLTYFLKNQAGNRFDYTDIANDLGLAGSEYVRELVSIGSQSSHILLSAAYDNEQDALKILERAKEQVLNVVNEIGDTYGVFTFKELSTTVTTVANYQPKWVVTQTTEVDNIIKAIDNLDKNAEKFNIKEEDLAPTEEVVPTVNYGNVIKRGILYGIVGAMAYALLLAVYLIMKGKVLSSEEVGNYYQLAPLANLSANKDNSHIFELAQDDIKAKKPDTKKIAIIGDVSEQELNTVKDGLKGKGDKEYVVLKNILDNTDDRTALKECDGAVLVNKIEKSTYKNINEMLKCAKDRNVELIGYITI